MKKPTRAISIRQPFVEQIFRGTKKEEYRTTKTHIRERVYVYASLKPFDSAAEWRKVGKVPGELPTGVLVGTVEIAGCRWHARYETWAYVLRNPIRFRRPLEAGGQPQPIWWKPVV